MTERRCGAFETATGKQCLLPTDHMSQHVITERRSGGERRVRVRSSGMHKRPNHDSVCEYLTAPEFPCNKCGGYDIRRTTDRRREK